MQEQPAVHIKRARTIAVQAHCYVLMYEPQPDAALIAQYKPLAMLALKADGWDCSFTVSYITDSAKGPSGMSQCSALCACHHCRLAQ